jgi:serine/threonine-protein kinase RsbW
MNSKDLLKQSFNAEPESIGLARSAVGQLAEALGMGESGVDDVKTIVSEACTNVVQHAYRTEQGTFEVEAFPTEESFTIIVRDFGAGIRPRLKPEGSSLKLGLGLISTLSSHFEISGGDNGTEVRVLVPLLA